MRRPPALYSIFNLLEKHLPHLPDRLRAVLALWVQGTLLGLNGCQDAVTLAPAVPAPVPVHVLCDQGLGSRDLWAQIVALGWHPCLRYPPHVTFQPEGQTQRVPVRSLIPGPGGLWVGTGRAFRDQPLEGTLMVLHAYGQAQP